MIRCKNVCKSYDTKAVLNGIDLDIPDGRIFGVICIAIVVFVIVFAWFPINDIKSWIGFLLSFTICTLISVVLSRREEISENRKMEQALRRFKG